MCGFLLIAQCVMLLLCCPDVRVVDRQRPMGKQASCQLLADSLHSWRPFAITSMHLSSCCVVWVFKSLTRTLVLTVAPASRQMRAAVLSIPNARVLRAPDLGQAALWSPNGPSGCRHAVGSDMLLQCMQAEAGDAEVGEHGSDMV